MPARLRLSSTVALAATVVACGAFPEATLGQAADTEVTFGDTVTESPAEVTAEVPIPAGKKPVSATGDTPAAPAAAPAVSAATGGSDARVGRLPFTGIDLLMLTGFAMIITGLGFALRWVSAPGPPRF